MYSTIIQTLIVIKNKNCINKSYINQNPLRSAKKKEAETVRGHMKAYGTIFGFLKTMYPFV